MSTEVLEPAFASTRSVRFAASVNVGTPPDSAEVDFKHDLGSELHDGSQISASSVFDRDGDGTVRHSYTARPQTDDDVFERGIDALCAVWNVLDLTPQGRGDWYATLSY